MKFLNILKNSLSNLKNNLVIKGTVILVITGLLTRIIGFYNRIFLSDLIGAKELGIYQLVLPLYIVIFAFTTCGNELALTMLVSEYSSRNSFESIKTFFRICITISLLNGIICAVLLYTNVDFVCTRILNAPDCTNVVKIICLAIPIVALKGCIHGYFMGFKISSVHGISDLVEQIAKIACVYLISLYIAGKSKCDASTAIMGMVAGEYISFFYSLYCYQKKEKILLKSDIYYPKAEAAPPILFSKATRIFLKNSIPMTTNRLAITMIQSIEAILIPTVLLSFYKNSDTSLSIYGIMMGISFPFIMFPATITNALSTMLMPAVSAANGNHYQEYLKKLIEKSMQFCLLIGLFSASLFYIYGKEIGLLFFQNKEAGIYLFELSFLCPLIYLSTTMASILNGLGHATTNLIQTIISTLIRIGFIIILIPKIGMIGYILGLFVSYLFLAYACLYRLSKIVEFNLSMTKNIVLPFFLFITSGFLLFYAYKKSIIIFTNAKTIILFITLCLYCIVTVCPMLFFTYKADRQPR